MLTMLAMLTMLTIAVSNDHLASFKHQNQILHPKKWYKTCVTLIYYKLKEMSCHEKSKMAAILDLGTVIFDWLID